MNRGDFGESALVQDRSNVSASKMTDLDLLIERLSSVDRGIAEMTQRLLRIADKLGGPQVEKAAGNTNAAVPQQMPGSLSRMTRHLKNAEAGLSGLNSIIGKFEETL